VTETEFLQRYHADKPILQAWGDLIVERVTSALNERLGDDARYFLRMPAASRVKDDQSIIDKAFYRGKPYSDPYAEITDKVGVRFVVLLSTEIATVTSIVETNAAWSWRKDRDFKEEAERNPGFFSYQSDHYILVPAAATRHAGVDIPGDTSCEVQVRTLLQHVYSEYKTDITPGSEVYRAVARSMALLETADDHLVRVAEAVNRVTATADAAKAHLRQTYEAFLGRAPNDARYHQEVCRAFAKELNRDTFQSDLERFVQSHDYLKAHIVERLESDPLLSQSCVLLLLMEIERDKFSAQEKWPFQPALLDGAFSLLGISR
jgi:putative GTP pyrophosphokinase